MKYAHILQTFYAEPWHLRPDYWRQYDAVLQRALAGQEVSPVRPKQLAAHPRSLQPLALSLQPCAPRPIVGPVDSETGEPIVPQMEVFGPVAVIPVSGVLGRHLSRLDLYCGGVDYLHIEEFTDMAQYDDEIRVVVYAIDSPGGMSAGCQECADAIAELSAAKVTIAYSDGVCCSAAYWLASQAREIWASPTSQIGNVGTILAGEDNSGQWAQEGRKLELFTSSPLKATGADGKPWTDADREYMQERMLQCDVRIKSAVRAGRGARLDPASLDGRFFFAAKASGAPGQSAMDVGMIDQLASKLDELLLQLWATMAGV